MRAELHRRHHTEVPAELRRSAPRYVRATTAGRVTAAALTFCVLAAIVSGVALFQSREGCLALEQRIAADGRRVDAEVTHVDRPRGENKETEIRYRFVLNGTEFRGTGELRERKPVLKQGSTLPVTYLANDPGLNWPAADQPEATPLFVVFLLPAVFLTTAVIGKHAMRKQKHLLEQGRVAEGRVVASKDLGHGATKSQQIEFEFQDLGGAKHTGTFALTKAGAVPIPLFIIYDRDDPSRHMVYPSSLWRISNF